MQSDTALQIVECCRALYDQGLIAGADGNITVRVENNRALVTPAGVIKSELTTDDLVEVDLAGKVLRGHLQPSSELDLHLRILGAREDVGAVVHAHPIVATGFGVAGITIDDSVLPELIHQMGHVPLVPYAAPGTPDLGNAVGPFVAKHDAMILANHGAVTCGTTLTEARIRMESLEHGARIILTARLLGKVNALEPEQIKHLELLRRSRDISRSTQGDKWV